MTAIEKIVSELAKRGRYGKVTHVELTRAQAEELLKDIEAISDALDRCHDMQRKYAEEIVELIAKK